MFETQLKMVSGVTDGAPRFDLVFLGMGDDGHTASLFPGTAPIHYGERLAVAHRVEKLNADRLTLTPPVLNNGREVVFLVGGQGKAAILRRVLEGPDRVDGVGGRGGEESPPREAGRAAGLGLADVLRAAGKEV